MTAPPAERSEPLKPFSIRVRVYYEDTDAAGVVYYANYLKFMERARTDHLRSMGIVHAEQMSGENLAFVVVHADISYHKPARLDDQLWVSSALPELGRSAVVFEQQVRRDGAQGELLCSGRIRAACVYADSLKPRSLPAIMRVGKESN
ncbi:MAG: tol-pal system-associated acyl-CoA thioesterase [Gammaproteobacteria bacterium]